MAQTKNTHTHKITELLIPPVLNALTIFYGTAIYVLNNWNLSINKIGKDLCPWGAYIIILFRGKKESNLFYIIQVIKISSDFIRGMIKLVLTICKKNYNFQP